MRACASEGVETPQMLHDPSEPSLAPHRQEEEKLLASVATTFVHPSLDLKEDSLQPVSFFASPAFFFFFCLLSWSCSSTRVLHGSVRLPVAVDGRSLPTTDQPKHLQTSWVQTHTHVYLLLVARPVPVLSVDLALYLFVYLCVRVGAISCASPRWDVWGVPAGGGEQKALSGRRGFGSVPETRAADSPHALWPSKVLAGRDLRKRFAERRKTKRKRRPSKTRTRRRGARVEGGRFMDGRMDR